MQHSSISLQGACGHRVATLALLAALSCLLHLQEAHVARLQGSLTAGGDASLQNAMNLATESLKSIPPYGHREARFLANIPVCIALWACTCCAHACGIT